MGEYTMSTQTNEGAPVYTSVHDKSICLYRTKTGKWMVGKEEDMPKRIGWLMSAGAADLPSKNGLAWKAATGPQNIPWESCSMTCSEA